MPTLPSFPGRDLTASQARPTGGTALAPLGDILGRVTDVRRFGGLVLGSGASTAQRNANTKTIADALLASFTDRSVGTIDVPGGPLYCGNDPSVTIRYNNALFYLQGCDNVLLRGNNTQIFLPGTSEADYIGLITFVRNTGTCGLVGNWRVDLQNPAVNQGRIAAYSAGAYIDVDLDWMPTWATVKCVTKWTEDAKPLAFLYARTTAGLPMTAITGGAGLRYRIDISGSTGGALTISNPSLTVVGDRVTLQHCTYTANVIHAIGNDHILIDDGVTIVGGAGMAMYGQASPTTWRASVRRPRRTGGRSFLSTTVDGIHLKGCGPSTIRGRIEGCGDDTVNVACWTDAITARNSDTSFSIALSNPMEGAPIVGDWVELIDETRASRGKWRVTTRVDSGGSPATAAALTVDTTSAIVPTDITTKWVCVNRTTAEGYVVDVRAGYNLGAAVRSSAADADITVDARNTRLELHNQGSYFNVEYMPAYDLRVSARGSNINTGIDAVRAGYAALTYRAFPRTDTSTGSAFLPKGAAGSVRILELDVTDTGNMAIYAAGLDHLTIDNARADRINQAPVSYDSLPNCFAQIILCKSVDISGMSNQGTTTWPINLSSCDAFTARGISGNITLPTTGATTITYDTRVVSANITDATTIGRSLLTTASAAAGATTLGLGTTNTPTWAGWTITGGGTLTAGSLYSDVSWGFLYRPRVAGNTAAHAFFNTAGDTARMVIKDTGNVGIGTTSPGAKLDVNGNANVSGALAVSGTLGLASFTVATLPAGVAGAEVYASNGRKVGEASGAGTGVPVYFSGGSWRRQSDDAAVAA